MSLEKDMLVNFAAIENLHAAINSNHQGIAASIETLTGKLNAMEGNWEGEDREAYAVRRKEWEQKEAEMRAALQRFNVEVLNAKTGYQGAERQNVRLMDSVAIPGA